MKKSIEERLRLLETKRLNRHQNGTEILEDLKNDIDQRTGMPKYPTGIKEVDDLTFGVHKKELMIIGARPSHAKSSLALAMWWNLVKLKVPSIYVSLEMSRNNLIERLCCQEYSINGWKLRKGFDYEREQFMKCLPDMHDKLSRLPYQIIDYMGNSVLDIEYLLNFFKPEIMVIDYIQKISNEEFSGRYEALSNYIQKVQDLAIEKDCAMIVVSQLGRSGEFLKGAGEIEETADTFLKCKWMCQEHKEYADKKEYLIQIEKQRHGPCDYRLVNFNAEYYTFSSRDFV